MGFEMDKEKYTDKIKEITLGKGENAIKVGGESALPFYSFEGEMLNLPKIAMEIWDKEPPEWPEAAREPFKEVIGDPAAWAKKCVQEYGAEMIVVQLKSTDPNDDDASPEETVAKVKKVLEAVNVPVAVWGTQNEEKDAQVLKKIAEDCEGENLLIGPIQDTNYKTIGAAVMAYGHIGIASSPIDINLAKQVNILLENLGLPLDRIIIDPTTGGLGYGMEYSYSIMERIKLAAMVFGDDKLQLPIFNDIANEVWGCKEAGQPVEENPRLGDPERRAIMMESVAAVNYIMAGSNILVMRHPEAIRMVRNYIDLLSQGGQAQDVNAIQKSLAEAEIDYRSYSPEMDLSIEEEKKKEAKKEEPAKPEAAEAAKEEAKPETAEAAKPAAEPAPEPAKEEAKPEAAQAESQEPAAAETQPAQEAAPAQPRQEAAAGGGVALGTEDLKSLIKETVQEVVQSMNREKEENAAKEDKAAQEKASKKEKEEDFFTQMARIQKEEAAKLEAEEEKLRQERKQERDKQLERKMQEMEEKIQRKNNPASEQKGDLEKLIDKTLQFNRWTQ